MKLKRPLQWIPCQLHANELPLCHLMKHLDGPTTTGPARFSGPIGSALRNCEQLLICKFDAIPSKLPELLTFSDQSTDQKYLYEICHSITSGSCTEDLARRNPGKIAHSCWLTTANRIQRFYVSSKKPSPALKMLTIFIVQVLYLYKYHVCVK